MTSIWIGPSKVPINLGPFKSKGICHCRARLLMGSFSMTLPSHHRPPRLPAQTALLRVDFEVDFWPFLLVLDRFWLILVKNSQDRLEIGSFWRDRAEQGRGFVAGRPGHKGSFFIGTLRKVLANLHSTAKNPGNYSTKVTQERFVIHMCKLPCRDYPLTSARHWFSPISRKSAWTKQMGSRNRNWRGMPTSLSLSCTRLRVPPVALHLSRYTCCSWFPGFYSVLQV